MPALQSDTIRLGPVPTASGVSQLQQSAHVAVAGSKSTSSTLLPARCTTNCHLSTTAPSGSHGSAGSTKHPTVSDVSGVQYSGR
eukprot:12935389-Prorocentrum_lima.AAC.1